MKIPADNAALDYGLLNQCLIEETDDSYHAKRSEFVTSSSLKDFIKNPKIYEAKQSGGVEKIRSEALYMGTLIHQTVLEGPHATIASYDFNSPINPKTDEPYSYNSKMFRTHEELALAEGKKLARYEDYGLAIQLRTAVFRHRIAKNLLSKGSPERVARCNYMGLPCQIKMDFITPWGIIDLKTTSDIERFNEGAYSDVHKYGYLNSAAFYRSVLHAFNPKVPKQDFYFIAVDKNEPYEVGVWKVSNEMLEVYEEENEEALLRLKESSDQDVWVSPFEDMRTI